MKFSAIFFASGGNSRTVYDTVFKVVEQLDQGPFEAIWTPERHFNSFGGAFPNPSLLSAALAMRTKRLELRAGSLLAPLHDPIRIVEEWSVVDNLSNGRAAISFGNGWNINDFVFFPERYASRDQIMWDHIREVQRLWQGGIITRLGHAGSTVELKVFPPPVRKDMPIWISSSGNVNTFIKAGEFPANLLTHFIGQNLSQLKEKIGLYRQARQRCGFDPATGVVTLMLHTFVSKDLELAREIAYKPLREYLRQAVDLEHLGAKGGGNISGRKVLPLADTPPDMLEELLDITTNRYMEEASLIGSPQFCSAMISRLQMAGVNEIACLVDFGLPQEVILDSLSGLEKMVHSMQKT